MKKKFGERTVRTKTKTRVRARVRGKGKKTCNRC